MALPQLLCLTYVLPAVALDSVGPGHNFEPAGPGHNFEATAPEHNFEEPVGPQDHNYCCNLWAEAPGSVGCTEAGRQNLTGKEKQQKQ